VTLEDLLSRLASARPRARRNALHADRFGGEFSPRNARSTLDLDIVIAPTRAQLLALMREFPGDRYYADEQQSLQALANLSQFNVIDFATGWKTDFIIAQDSAYGRSALARRVLIDVAGTAVYVAAPEDVLIEPAEVDKWAPWRTVLGLLRSTTVAHVDLCCRGRMPHSSSTEPSRIIQVGDIFFFHAAVVSALESQDGPIGPHKSW
jgi:hypothetical protein